MRFNLTKGDKYKLFITGKSTPDEYKEHRNGHTVIVSKSVSADDEEYIVECKYITGPLSRNFYDEGFYIGRFFNTAQADGRYFIRVDVDEEEEIL